MPGSFATFPTTAPRWCTERLKIDRSNPFIINVVREVTRMQKPSAEGRAEADLLLRRLKTQMVAACDTVEGGAEMYEAWIRPYKEMRAALQARRTRKKATGTGEGAPS